MHTEGRMTVEMTPNERGGIYDLRIDRYYIALIPGGMTPGVDAANAQRLAACWNLCDGLSLQQISDSFQLAEANRKLSLALDALGKAREAYRTYDNWRGGSEGTRNDVDHAMIALGDALKETT